ncbi:aminotransferase class V-fold PLP-dependent enzyme [Solimonas marina]|uniref:Aminotransferase class V-fold PLP-dependent enzyme n=1 Tax=Solimonas marina TaxID=2714601 RepID=A0A969WAB5_9GAMM|nr:aminotransferase class V-fold PLP-dependent enzyme [Solimonas marina]
MSRLDTSFVRSQFPAYAFDEWRDAAFFENAGGSLPCRQVVDRLGEYYRRLKVQPYHAYPAAQEAGAWMDAAYVRIAEYLGVTSDEVQFGPSTSQNAYVLAQAFRRRLRPGDEIVVTDQDHEANSGAWRRLAENGIVVREWRVQRDSGSLDPADLDALLGPRTRLVAFPQVSNLLGEVNPVTAICAKIRAAGAVSVVDGVSYAPHGLPDVPALGADIYLFSAYKTFGPHQGVMVIRRPLLDELGNEAHYFHAPLPHRRYVPAGPDHAQVAAMTGIAEYFDVLDAHHGGGDVSGRAARVRALLGDDAALLQPILEFVDAHPALRLLGPRSAHTRAGLVAFVPAATPPLALVETLGRDGVLTGSGNFYSTRLCEALGIDPALGVVRVSLAHYNTATDVDRLLTSLARALGS